jgi:quercetin dioxygenase-like cupin family protein
MFTISKLVLSRAGLVAALALIASAARAQQVAVPVASAHGDSAEAERQWFPTPSILPVGGKLAVVSGNPFASGTFTLEFAMPDGYTLPPHTNPSNEHVFVKSGALMVGVGPRIDRRKSATLTTGDTASAPAGVPHWSIAQGETRLIITEATGPYGIAYMSLRDEPGSHPFPSGYNH